MIEITPMILEDISKQSEEERERRNRESMERLIKWVRP